MKDLNTARQKIVYLAQHVHLLASGEAGKKCPNPIHLADLQNIRHELSEIFELIREKEEV